MRNNLLVVCTVLTLAAASPTAVAQKCEPAQLHKLLADDAASNNLLGVSVAIDETTAIVGAHFDNDNGSASGSAYLFDITTGMQITKLLPDDGAENDHFGESVAIDGPVAIVGAHWDDDNGDDSGSAYLFDTATGAQLFKLLPDDGAAGDSFGEAVAIAGSIAIVGARDHDDGDNGTRSGAAYLFDTATGAQLMKLTPDDGAEIDNFGNAVAIDGSIAIVAAIWDDDNGSSSGAAYLFDTATGDQLHKPLPDDGAAFDNFGVSVDIAGATAIVGAWSDDDNGSSSGAAYLYDTSTGAQLTKLLPDDGVAQDQFGVSVAIDGQVAIIGIRRNDPKTGPVGAAYLFDASIGEQLVKLTAENPKAADAFGVSVAISSNIAIAGTPFDSDNGANSGSAYLFEHDCAPAKPGDLNGDSVVDEQDRALLCAALGTSIGDPDFLEAADFDENGTVDELDQIAFSALLPPCAGDAVSSDTFQPPADGVTDGADLAYLLGAWGEAPSCADMVTSKTFQPPPDGVVDGADLAFLLGAWGDCP